MDAVITVDESDVLTFCLDSLACYCLMSIKSNRMLESQFRFPSKGLYNVFIACS